MSYFEMSKRTLTGVLSIVLCAAITMASPGVDRGRENPPSSAPVKKSASATVAKPGVGTTTAAPETNRGTLLVEPGTNFPDNFIPGTPAAGEQIKWQVISGGGNRGTSTNYILSGTVGQTATGLATSTNYRINSGFWQNFSTSGGGCCLATSADGLTGNLDGEMPANIDISDVTALIYFLYIPPYPPLVCPESGNMDGELPHNIDISDVTALIYRLYIPPYPPLAPCH